jgi:DNA-binding CsgD family transcriptional regulator
MGASPACDRDAAGGHEPAVHRVRHPGGLVRRLALIKLQELRRMGLSYLEIGRRYGRSVGEHASPHDGSDAAARRLIVPRAATASETVVFLRALDAVEQGLAFYSPCGTLLHANRRFHESFNDPGENAEREIQLLVRSVDAITRIRGISGSGEVAEGLVVHSVSTGETAVPLRGSYIGLDLFGHGGSILVAVERTPHDPLSDEKLKKRFGLSRQERRTLRLLVDGRSNQEIAAALSISPHTARHHTERVLMKLGVKSRAEVGSRVLRAARNEQ